MSIKTYNTDTILKKLGVTTYELIDTLLKQSAISEYLANVIFQSIDNAKSYLADIIFKQPNITAYELIDVLFQKLGVPTSDSIDVLFVKLGTPKYSIDVLLQKLGVTKYDSIDVLFKKLNVTTSDSIDVLFASIFSSSVYILDIVIKEILTAPYILDVFIASNKVTKIINYTIDILIKRLSDTSPYNIDVKFIKQSVATYFADIILKKSSILRGYNVDTLLLGTFFFDWIIEHGYIYEDIPSVPKWLTEEMKLDTNIWNKRLRKLELTARLTDYDKNDIQQNYLKSIVGVNDSLNDYTVWIEGMTSRKVDHSSRPWEVDLSMYVLWSNYDIVHPRTVKIYNLIDNMFMKLGITSQSIIDVTFKNTSGPDVTQSNIIDVLLNTIVTGYKNYYIITAAAGNFSIGLSGIDEPVDADNNPYGIIGHIFSHEEPIFEAYSEEDCLVIGGCKVSSSGLGTGWVFYYGKVNTENYPHSGTYAASPAEGFWGEVYLNCAQYFTNEDGIPISEITSWGVWAKAPAEWLYINLAFYVVGGLPEDPAIPCYYYTINGFTNWTYHDLLSLLFTPDDNGYTPHADALLYGIQIWFNCESWDSTIDDMSLIQGGVEQIVNGDFEYNTKPSILSPEIFATTEESVGVLNFNIDNDDSFVVIAISSGYYALENVYVDMNGTIFWYDGKDDFETAYIAVGKLDTEIYTVTASSDRPYYYPQIVVYVFPPPSSQYSYICKLIAGQFGQIILDLSFGILNGDFETGVLDPWVYNEDTTVISTENPHSGTFCASSNDIDPALSISQEIGIGLDELATFTFWIRSNETNNTCVYIETIEEGVYNSYTINLPDTTTDWKQYDLKALMIINDVKGTLNYIEFYNDWVTSGTAIDDVIYTKN